MMPDGIKLGSLAKGGFGSIVDNVFRNTTNVPWSSYNRDDAQMITGAEAYAYRPEVIRDSLIVMTVGQRAWLTQRLSPVAIIPETTKVITWQVTRFKQTMATQVPNLGIPRQSRHERIKVQAAVQRFGKAYSMEHDFMNTREGLRYHLAMLEQMANSMRDTIYYDILSKVVDAHEWERSFVRQKKLFIEQSADEYFRKQVWSFAILQKQHNAFPIMAADIEEKMTYWGGDADVFIIPPQIIRYVNLVPRENNSFMEAGPIGQQRLYDSIRPFATSGVNDVFIARSYFQDEMMGARQLLEDTKEFGEFYRMASPEYDPDVEHRTKHMHIQIYSHTRDAMAEIKVKTALKHCHLFIQGGADDGAPLYIDNIEDGYGPYARSGDEQLDLWSYRTMDANGVVKSENAELFGQMEPRYFPVEDKQHLAHTVVAAIRNNIGADSCSKLLCDFNAGLDLLRRIQGIGGADLDRVLAIARAAAFGTSQRVNPLSPTVGLEEFRQDPTTGFVASAPAAGVLDRLLPGLQSEAGLRYLIRYGEASLNAEKEIAAKFLAAVGEIVRYLDTLFPGNLALSESFVSSVWQFPTNLTAMIDNLLTDGYNPPLFVRAGANAAAPVAVLQDMINGWNDGAGNASPLRFELSESIAEANAGLQNPADPSDGQVDYAFIVVGMITLMNPARLDPAQTGVVAGIIGRRASAGGDEIANIVSRVADGASEGRAIAVQLRAAAPAAASGVARDDALNAFVASLLSQARQVRATGGGRYYRTPFLVSRALATYLERNPNPDVLVGNPAFPDLPTQPAEALPMIVGSRQPGESGFNSALMSTLISATLGDMYMGARSASENVGMDIGAAPSYSYPVRTPATRAAIFFGGGQNPAAQVPAANQLDVYSETARFLISSGAALFTQNMQASWRAIDSFTPNPLHRAIMHIYDLTPIHKRAYEQWIANNILLNIDFYVVRPHIQVSALDVIKVKAGSDTMMTGVAPGQFEVGDDPNTQSHLGTMTSKHVILVLKPENVCNQKGAMINGVLGGLGTNPIDPRDYDMAHGDFTNQDIIYIPVSRRDTIDGNVLSLTGSLEIAELQMLSLKLDSKGPQYETYPRMNKVFGFIQNRVGSASEDSVVGAAAYERSNVICLAGTHITVDPLSNKFKFAVQGASYLTGLISPKCGDLLSGKMVARSETAWSKFVEV